MKINWKVRFKNPVFIMNCIMAIFAPILTYLGVEWSQITTWESLFLIIKQGFLNPVIAVSVAVSLWNAINDPTTAGNSDSLRALTYINPVK